MAKDNGEVDEDGEGDNTIEDDDNYSSARSLMMITTALHDHC